MQKVVFSASYRAHDKSATEIYKVGPFLEYSTGFYYVATDMNPSAASDIIVYIDQIGNRYLTRWSSLLASEPRRYMQAILQNDVFTPVTIYGVVLYFVPKEVEEHPQPIFHYRRERKSGSVFVTENGTIERHTRSQRGKRKE